MSAFGGKADVRELPAVCPLIATSGHSVSLRYTSADSQIALPPTVRQRPLPVTDERLHGEKLSVSATEDSSPLKRGFLYGALASLILGCVIILIMSLVF